ncbi:hypothetical protein DEO72_LG5g2817 [Vigna unguiculata]|uniref:Uncharacterized protein n=1 Tax=Vigna unguiculata TaxID=3917 RepID=A0A4D6M0R2_VIGUN|nr:hypothetical protein DEO72_LG5g2817 [Vigna unguiculata]
MTLEDDAIQRVRKLQEITKNTRESHKKSNKNALKIYLKKYRGATIAAKEPKLSRGGGGTPEHLQRDRERDHCRSSVAGGETTRRQGAVHSGRSRGESARQRRWRGFLAGSRGERTRRACVVFSTGWQWWRSEMEEEQREMVAGQKCREKWREIAESCAREEERGCCFEP